MIGEQFGNYRAVSLLGKGGMGAVYLAEHPGIGRKVAVKVLRAKFSSDPQVCSRFLNEARAANAIRHPNIIEILDSGTTTAGTPYLVMELLEGESIADRLRRTGPLPYPVAFELAYQTASALAAAHRKSIIHRDLKPDNLFVVPEQTDPARERLKVLDFGIAKLQDTTTGDPVKTATGMLMGTPVYMSPEQCLGTRAIDQRTDIYSLGVILFEMVCGHPPFYSEGFGALVHMHLNVAPPAPRGIVPGLPLEAEQVILRALAKNPDDRYSSMDEMKIAIKAASEGAFPVRGASSPPGGGGVLVTPAQGTRQRPAATTPLPAQGGGAAFHPTTLSTAAGESGQRIGRTRTGAGRWPLVGALVVGLAVGGWFLYQRRGDVARDTTPAATAGGGSVVIAKPGGEVEVKAASPTTTPATPTVETPPPPPPATMTRIQMRSRPPGARVVRVADGSPLGTTPFELTVPGGPGGRMEVRVERDGYLPETRSLALDADHPESFELEKRAAARPPGGKRPKPRPKTPDDPPPIEEPAKL